LPPRLSTARRAAAIRNWHAGGWTPMRRLGKPEDIGNVASLLCSEKANWITGQVIYADGGASLMNPEIPPEIQIA
jgi:enoyl-[acyl-carrier-protein] reductase (NADH)